MECGVVRWWQDASVYALNAPLCTLTSCRCSTPVYMSPELINSKNGKVGRSVGLWIDERFLVVVSVGGGWNWRQRRKTHTLFCDGLMGLPPPPPPPSPCPQIGYDGRSVDAWASGILLLVMLLGSFPFDHTGGWGGGCGKLQFTGVVEGSRSTLERVGLSYFFCSCPPTPPPCPPPPPPAACRRAPRSQHQRGAPGGLAAAGVQALERGAPHGTGHHQGVCVLGRRWAGCVWVRCAALGVIVLSLVVFGVQRQGHAC